MPADILGHMSYVYGYSAAELTRRSSILGPDYRLGPSFIASLRKSGAMPSLRHIYAISEVFHITIGSAFLIFGIDLDELVREEAILNKHRTRLVESYIFGGDRLVWVPATLGEAFQTKQTAHLSELIPEWRQVPVHTLTGKAWRNRNYIYGKLGIHDSNAAPDIPPGAGVQIRRLRRAEFETLSPHAFYFVQHPWGYTACRCTYRDGWLYLHSRDPSRLGLHRLRYGCEAIILGEITAFTVDLPTEGYRKAEPVADLSTKVAACEPWRQPSFESLLHSESLRNALKAEHVDFVSAKLRPRFHIGVTGKYALSMDHSRHTAHAGAALVESVSASIRFTDMFRSYGIRINDVGKFHLKELLSIRHRDSLPIVPRPTPPPVPQEAWDLFRSEWHEWPLPFAASAIDPGNGTHEVLRIHQERFFRGLDPLVRSGSLLTINTSSTSRMPHGNNVATDWARPLHVVERTVSPSTFLCGYLASEGNMISIVPHPAAEDPSYQTFRQGEVRVIGNVTAITSRVA